jgi:hypothetical protein
MDKGQTLTQIFKTTSKKQTDTLGIALGAMFQEIYEHKKALGQGLYKDPVSGAECMLVAVEGHPCVGKSSLCRPMMEAMPSMQGEATVRTDIKQPGRSVHWRSCWSDDQQNRMVDGWMQYMHSDTEKAIASFGLPARTLPGIDYYEHASMMLKDMPAAQIEISRKPILVGRKRLIMLELNNPDEAEAEIFQRHVGAPELAKFIG